MHLEDMKKHVSKTVLDMDSPELLDPALTGERKQSTLSYNIFENIIMLNIEVRKLSNGV